MINARYTVEQLAWLKAHAKLSRAKLTDAFNNRFNQQRTEQAIKGTLQRNGIISGRTGRFKKGSPSWNKGLKGVNGSSSTTFTKGLVPHNHRPVGHVRYCTKDGYMSVKMTDTGFTVKDYIAVHRLVYEHYHGPIPKNHIISFIDGDIYNFRIENLELVSRGLHAVRCKTGYYNYPVEMRPQLDLVIELRRATARAKEQRKAKRETRT